MKAQSCVMNYHWAYGYFAAKMVRGYIAADVCNKDEMWLSVPDGFSENSYVWYAGADSASAQRTQIYDGLHNIFISRKNGTQIYPYYRCEVKTQAGVPIIYECKVDFLSDLHPSFRYEQVTCDSIYTLNFHDVSSYNEIRPSSSGMMDTIAYPVQYVEWDFGDGSPVETSLNPSHVFPNLGYYPVTLKIYDKHFRCCDSIMSMVLVDTKNHSSIETFEEEELNVFPNPTNGNVSIVSASSQIEKVDLFDLSGKLILSQPVNGKSVILDLYSCPAGMYLARIATGNATVTKRIMKK